MSVGGSNTKTGFQTVRPGVVIPLTRGMFARVDDADAEWVSQLKWYAHSCGNGAFYAGHSESVGKSRCKTVLMHREIMGAEPGQFVDHINGDKMDNRRANLRICTPEQNRFNVPARFGTSEFKGVSRHSKNPVWVAHITFRGKNRYLGSFQVESDAARAYDAAAAEAFGEFAHLNFPVGASA